MTKTVLLPHGSENICCWCVKNGKYELFEKNPKLQTYRAVSRPPIKIGEQTFDKSLVKSDRVHFLDLIRSGSLQGCLINEFIPDLTKLKKTFGTIFCKIR